MNEIYVVRYTCLDMTNSSGITFRYLKNQRISILNELWDSTGVWWRTVNTKYVRYTLYACNVPCKMDITLNFVYFKEDYRLSTIIDYHKNYIRCLEQMY